MFLSICLLALLAGSALAYDGRVTVNYGYGQGWSNGGEFDIDIVNWNDPNGWTTQVTPRYPYPAQQHSEFATFCVQERQYFYPGHTYDFDVSTRSNTGENIELDPKTAYLFHKWNSGQLGDYNYSGAGSHPRGQDGRDLQVLFWMYQLQRPYSHGALSEQAKAWDTEATTAVSNGTWHGFGNVRIMQLHGSDFPNAQDQLYEQLVPEPGSIALLATGALGLLPLLRRRRTS